MRYSSPITKRNIVYLAALISARLWQHPVLVQAQSSVDQRSVVDTLDPNLPNVNADKASFAKILSIAFIFTGALSVLFIVIGGLRYALSSGDPQAIEGAKNTILYAIIGMIISISAFAIVNFVLGRV